MYKLIMKQINAAYRDARIQKPENNKWHTKRKYDEHMFNWNSQRRLEKWGRNNDNIF